MHEQFYAELECRNIVWQKNVELENPVEYSNVVQEIKSWGWGTLANLIDYVNLEIVKEFYANAKPIDEAPLARISWVWGREVSYDRDVIRAYIKDNYVTNSINLDPFLIHL